jgi:RNA polymerase sigma-54 factor
MALEIKLGQDLRLRQQLVMTPQLQQAIKILQLSLPELEAVVQNELDQNPMLELLDSSPTETAAPETIPDDEGPGVSDEPLQPEPERSLENGADTDVWSVDGPPAAEQSDGVHSEAPDATVEIRETDRLEKLDWREYLETYSNNWQESGGGGGGGDFEERPNALENLSTRRTSLEDHLIWQLRLSNLDQDSQRIGAAIIYNLNGDGYVVAPIEELAAQLEVEPAVVERVLGRIQKFDPPGVGARDLRECLLLQLHNLGMEESLAARVVRGHLDLLEKHRYAETAKQLNVSVEAIGQAAKIISLLEPKPARDYGGDEPAYISPDVYITKVGEEYVVTLNREAVPQLRLASYYQRVLHDDGANAETREYLQERLRSAKWLVKSIYQRQQTILKVAGSIVKFQRAFFDHGISLLRPLVLKNVADDIGMHESTISRATANKYAHTPQGIFELKFFFTSGVKGTSGEDVSAETVKEQIRAMVANEPSDNPLSDQAIAGMLRAREINIARRTVAKYRQALGILPSANRRQVSVSAQPKGDGHEKGAQSR